MTRERKKEKHECGEFKCQTCNIWTEERNHKCYMQRKEPKKGKDKIIYFDFESRQESGKHEINFGIAKVKRRIKDPTKCETELGVEEEYYGINDYGVWKLEPKFKIEESELEMFTMENFKITPEHVPGILEGNTIDYFCKFFLREKFKGFTFIAHYGKGFDFHPIAGWCITHKLKPYKITNGNKISYMKIDGLSIKFIDSINFTMCPLKAFPSTFGFKGNKGHFPHLFNKQENQNYIGPYPPLNDYGYNTMSGMTKEQRIAKDKRKEEKLGRELTKSEKKRYQKKKNYLIGITNETD